MIQKARGEDSQSLLREIAYSCLVLPTETQAERDSDIYFLRQLSKILKAQRATRITTTSDGRKEIKGNKDLVIDAKIVEPQPKEPQALLAPQPQPKSDKEIELELTQAKAELLDKQNRAKELDIEEKEVDLEILRQKNISEGKIKPDLDLDSPEANQQEKIALFEEFIKQMAENGSMFGADIAKDFQAKLKELK